MELKAVQLFDFNDVSALSSVLRYNHYISGQAAKTCINIQHKDLLQ